MYADLTGNRKKYRIKSRYGNKKSEGRILYDAFILNNKADAIYYNGTAITGTAAATGASGPTGG